MRNVTGDNGKVIMTLSYEGMQDMYGNIITVSNGNLAYAQLLDKQVDFDITGATLSAEEIQVLEDRFTCVATFLKEWVYHTN